MYKKCYSTRLKNNKFKIHLWDEGGYDEIEWTNYAYKECKEDILLRNGDLVLCMANGSKRLVGKSAKYFGEDSKDITIGAFICMLSTFNKLCNFWIHLNTTSDAL